MVRRLLRVTGTVLVIAVAFVTPVLATTAAPAAADTVVDGCTIVSNPTPTNFTNCPAAHLVGADLSGLDLSYANLSGADLTNAALVNCFFVTLFSGECQDAVMQQANLSGSNLSNSSLGGCVVSIPPSTVLACGSADMRGANLAGANLSNVSFGPGLLVFFGGCANLDCIPDLTGANLTGANLTGSPFIPSSQSVQATSTAGAVVNWNAPSNLGATLGTCTPPSGSTFPLGTTTVTCQVLDDSGDVAGGTFSVTVTQVATLANVVSSTPNPSLLGKPVTYTASVFVNNPGAGTAQLMGGSVAFSDNGSLIPECSAVAISETSDPSTATATCSTVPAAGAHNITAQYSGSGIFAKGPPGVVFVQVVTNHPCQTLAGCNLSGLNLSSDSWGGIDLGQADLQGANLEGANLSGTNLFDANLEGANLQGANLTDAYIASANLSDANLHGANLSGAFETNGSAGIFPADLTGANLSDANLTDAELSEANLTGANVTGANLTDTELAVANMTGANVTGATWSNTTCPDFTNSDDDGGTCVGHLF